MIIRCARCGRQLVVPDGATGACPGCGELISSTASAATERMNRALAAQGLAGAAPVSAGAAQHATGASHAESSGLGMQPGSAWEAQATSAAYANGSQPGGAPRRWSRMSRAEAFAQGGLPAQILRWGGAGAMLLVLAVAGYWFRTHRSAGAATPGEDSLARRWVYALRTTAEGALEKELNEQGAAGWELVVAQRSPDNQYQLIYKKPEHPLPAAAAEEHSEAGSGSPPEGQEPEPPRLKTDLRRFEQDFNPPKKKPGPVTPPARSSAPGDG